MAYKLVEDYLNLPAKQAINLYNSQDSETQSLLKEALINLHEMSMFYVVSKSAFRSTPTELDNAKDTELVRKQIEEYRKFLEDPDITVKDAIKVDLMIKKNKQEFDKFSDKQVTEFLTKLEYYDTLLGGGV